LIKKFIDQVADYITKKHNIKVTLKWTLKVFT
jgi:hypothetical protein